MKVKRHKRIRKHLQYYLITYGIRPPYKVLLDGAFLQAALENKVLIKEQIPKLLQEETSVMVTKCVVHALKEAGSFFRGAAMIGDKLAHARCAHTGVVPPGECLRQLLADGNPDQFLVGAQEVELRNWVRNRPKIPLMFLRGPVPVMEPPSGSSKSLELQERTKKTGLTSSERAVLKELRGDGKPSLKKAPKKKKPKGPKQPNPLSMKKKKKKGEGKKSEKSAGGAPKAEPKEAASDKNTTDTAAGSSSATTSEVAPTPKRKRVRKRKRKEDTMDTGAGKNTEASSAAP